MQPGRSQQIKASRNSLSTHLLEGVLSDGGQAGWIWTTPRSLWVRPCVAVVRSVRSRWGTGHRGIRTTVLLAVVDVGQLCRAAVGCGGVVSVKGFPLQQTW